MYKKILCPVDGSKISQRSLREAVRLAVETDAKLLVLHVIDNTDFLVFPPAGSPMYDFMFEEGQKVLNKATRSARRSVPDVESKLVAIRTGRVAKTIVATARQFGADLIVMGTHGRRALATLVLGSEAAAVVASSRTPVLLVK
jgi:nucleotide-binding universal stress UspA family protein